MVVEVCPADLVHAPVETVWSLLSDPSQYDRWWDAHTTRIDPPGPAVAGQSIQGWTQAWGKRWTVDLRVEEVIAERHQIRFRSALALGIGMMNHISCTAIDSATCRVQFG